MKIFKIDRLSPVINTRPQIGSTDIDTSKIKLLPMKPKKGGGIAKFWEKVNNTVDNIIKKKNALTDLDIKLPSLNVNHNVEAKGFWQKIQIPLLMLLLGIFLKRLLENNDKKRKRRKY